MRNEVAIARSITVMAVLGVIAALYFAKAVFVPLALAILLTFVLAPAVRLLRSWGLPKPPAVILVVAFAFSVILGIGALVGQQVTKLAHRSTHCINTTLRRRSAPPADLPGEACWNGSQTSSDQSGGRKEA